MRNGINWKTAIKYTTSMLILALSVAAALVFPQWYGEWQDSRGIGTVTLSNRENIRFLDTDSLDIAGRMQLLAKAEEIYIQSYGEDRFEADEAAGAFLNRCRKNVQLWCDSGLLPKECIEIIQEMNGDLLGSPYIYADQSVFQVDIVYFYGQENEALLLVMDSEKDVIYYASLVSDSVSQQMAEIFGYASFDEFVNAVEQLGEFSGPNVTQEDYSGYDFAAVCGAEAAKISGQPGRPELEVELQFENFTAYAYRRLIGNMTGAGMATMYGTERWLDIVRETAVMFGFYEEPIYLDYAVDAAGTYSAQEAGAYGEAYDMEDGQQDNMEIVY